MRAPPLPPRPPGSLPVLGHRPLDMFCGMGPAACGPMPGMMPLAHMVCMPAGAQPPQVSRFWRAWQVLHRFKQGSWWNMRCERAPVKLSVCWTQRKPTASLVGCEVMCICMESDLSAMPSWMWCV